MGRLRVGAQRSLSLDASCILWQLDAPCVVASLRRSWRRRWRIAPLLTPPPPSCSSSSSSATPATVRETGWPAPTTVHAPDTCAKAISPSGSPCLHPKAPTETPRMIKNGHHHHQVNAGAVKDAAATPGAAACSPEKRRRKIRVWCDGWWVIYRIISSVTGSSKAASIICFRLLCVNVSASLLPPGQACCRSHLPASSSPMKATLSVKRCSDLPNLQL